MTDYPLYDDHHHRYHDDDHHLHDPGYRKKRGRSRQLRRASQPTFCLCFKRTGTPVQTVT